MSADKLDSVEPESGYANYSANIFLDAILLEIADPASQSEHSLSLSSVLVKTAILILWMLPSAYYTWELSATFSERRFLLVPIVCGLLLDVIVGIFALLFKLQARYIGPLFAVIIGFSVGAITAAFDQMVPGVAVQAVGITIGIICTLLCIYYIIPINKIRASTIGVFSSLAGVIFIYGFVLFLRQQGLATPYPHDLSVFGILSLLVITVFGTISMLENFEYARQLQEKYIVENLEWYVALGLFVMLVWIYIDMLYKLARKS